MAEESNMKTQCDHYKLFRTGGQCAVCGAVFTVQKNGVTSVERRAAATENASSSVDDIDLARLVFKRFDCNQESAAAAWRRMLQNSDTVTVFMSLVSSETHTPNCDGFCQGNNDH